MSRGTSLKSAVRSCAKHVAVQEDRRPPTRSEIMIVRRAGQPAVLKRTVATVLFSTPRPLSLLYQHDSARKFIGAAAVTHRPSVRVNAVIVRCVLLLSCQPLRVDCICCLQFQVTVQTCCFSLSIYLADFLTPFFFFKFSNGLCVPTSNKVETSINPMTKHL